MIRLHVFLNVPSLYSKFGAVSTYKGYSLYSRCDGHREEHLKVVNGYELGNSIPITPEWFGRR